MPRQAEAVRSRAKDPTKEATAILTAARIRKLPIDVQALAEANGAVVVSESFEGDISGVVMRRPDGPTTIGYNSAHPLTRRRFTIAHELGHLRLHEGEPLIVDKLVVYNVNLRRSGIPNDQIEREANKFAATLLMPKVLVMREVVARLPKRGPVADFDGLVNELADVFAVSPQAMTVRLRELGVISAFGA